MLKTAHIELFNRHDRSDKYCDGLMVRLYRQFDGSPSGMGLELEHKVKEARRILEDLKKPSWWDGEMVGALFVALSVGEMGLDRVPAFQPTCVCRADIDYLWRVYLGPDPCEYAIECLRVNCDIPVYDEETMTAVDWKKEAGV